MSITITEWIADLAIKSDKPCDGALEWLATLSPESTMSDAWEQCKRSDWMRWAAFRSPMKETDERWRMAGCAIIRRVKVRGDKTLWDLATDPRSRNAVEVSERFSRGQATSEELAAAASSSAAAASAAAYAPYPSYATYAAYATCAPSASASAASYAAYAAYAAYTTYASSSAAAAEVLREFIADPWADEAQQPEMAGEGR